MRRNKTAPRLWHRNPSDDSTAKSKVGKSTLLRKPMGVSQVAMIFVIACSLLVTGSASLLSAKGQGLRLSASSSAPVGCVLGVGATGSRTQEDETDDDSSESSELLQLQDVFALEYVSDPQVSPDGKRIVFVRNSMDIMQDRVRQTLWLIDRDGSDLRPLTSGDRNDRSPRWSPQGDRIAFVSSESGRTQIHMLWLDDGREAVMSRLTQGPAGVQWSPDGRQLAFSMFVPESQKPLVQLPGKPEGAEWADPAKVITDLRYRSDGSGYLKPGRRHLFVLPAIGGTPRQLTDGDYDHAADFCWTPDGEAIIFSANRHPDEAQRPLDSNLYRVRLADKQLEQLTDRDGPDANPVISPDGRYLAYTGFQDQRLGFQTGQITLLDLETGKSYPVARDLDRTASDLQWTKQPRQLLFSYDSEGVSHVAAVTVETLSDGAPAPGALRTLARGMGGTSIGRPYPSGSFSVSPQGIVALTYCSAIRPAELAVVEPRAEAPRQLTQFNDDLFADKQAAPVEEIWVQSAYDRRKVQAWVVKPPQFDPAERYPMILEIHGGPFLNYGPRFAMEMQLYAAAGYVVVYVNPRGSTSYGAEFANLIHHRYPGEDYDDLMSVVDHVIDAGYVDPDQLFVTGGSGGGVLSAWIVGQTNRFRAAVVAKPVINWYSFVLTADAADFFYQYWFPGPPWEYPEQYLKRSPLSLVGNVQTPTMLLTGEEDYRTPISETEQFYQALKIRGVETAMVRIPGASHGITSRPSNLMSKAAHVLKWFEQHRE